MDSNKNTKKSGFKNDGLLYFSQRIDEMLFHYTDHVFMAPILNTALLVDEYLETSKLVESGIINDNHLKQIMEEFKESFNNDIVLKNRIDEDKKKRILHRINSSSLIDQEKNMEYVRYLLKDYNKWCKEVLEEIVPQEKEKKKIEKALRCYLPGLIASGYSREYIYHFNKEIFIKRPVKSLDALTKFLNRFDFDERKYDVFIPIDIDAVDFIKANEKNLNVDLGPLDSLLYSGLRFKHDKYQVVRLKIKALDEQTAAWKAYIKLNSLFTYYRFFSEGKENWFSNIAKVIDENKEASFVNLKYQGLDYTKDVRRESLAKGSMAVAVLLKRNAKDSCDLIFRALNAHNSANDGIDVKTRFLNLWSTLEILLVSSKEESKITEIKNKLVPILKNDYLSYLHLSIEASISKLIDRDRIQLIIEKVDEEDRNHWLLFVIALDKYEKQRTELYSLLKSYPVLRSRIALLHEMCNNKKEFLKSIDTFEQRVDWHITRLYRTRNTIIHSGLIPKNTEDLTEHLHSYVDECLNEIIVSLATNPQLGTISNCIIDAQIRSEDNSSLLSGNNKICREVLISLFSLR